MKLKVNSIRIVDNDQAKEHSFGNFQTLKDNLAISFINPVDFIKLKLAQGLHLKLINEYGEVVMKVKQDEDVPSGTINIPVSIWANQITGIENDELIFKSLEVTAEVTRDPILDFKQLLAKIKGSE